MNFKSHNPTIILIAGKAQSGKTTLANYIKDNLEKENKQVILSPYTKYLKQYIEDITEEKITEKNKPRDLLQKLSSELIKKKLGYNNLFIERQIEDINIYSYFKDYIIIPDVRFKNEIDIIKEKFNNTISIKMERKNFISNLTKEQQNDITETSLDNEMDFDYIIENNSNTDLNKEAINLIQSIEERRKTMNNIVIAIDGPCGSGKGTLAKALAEKFNLVNIDTGATYRCVALKTLREKINIEDTDKIIKIAKNIRIDLKEDGTVLLDGEDVTKEIRSKEVTEIVSPISSIIEVREALVDIQRKIAGNKNVVMEGRDITTVVLPDAKYKFYLDANLECRIERRFKENQEKGIQMTYEEVKDNIEKRDYNDTHKKVGSLKRTEDQIYIDNTNLTIDEEIQIIEKIIKGD